MVNEPNVYNADLQFILNGVPQNVYVDPPNREITNCRRNFGSNITIGQERSNQRCDIKFAFESKYPNLNWLMTGHGFSTPFNNAAFRSGFVNFPFDFSKLQRLYNDFHGITQVETTNQPQTYIEWVSFANAELLLNNERNDIVNELESLRQIDESQGRNDITEDQAIELIKQVLVSSGTITREDIENIADSNNLPFDPNQLISNINILLNNLDDRLTTLNTLLQEILSGEFIGVQVGGQDPNQLGGLETRDLHTIKKEQADNILNDTIPNIINPLNQMFDQADQFNIDITQEHNRYDFLINFLDQLKINIGAIIDESPSLSVIAGIPINEIKEVIV